MVATITALSPIFTVGFSMVVANPGPVTAGRCDATIRGIANSQTRARATRRMIMLVLSAAGRRAGDREGHRRRRTPQQRLRSDREDPDDPALRDVLVPSEEVGEETLLVSRIDAPAGCDPDVLHAVNGERDGRRRDAGVRAEL